MQLLSIPTITTKLKPIDFGGIRIEDDILVTESGYRVLGKPIPKTIAEVEAPMAEGK